MNRYYGPLLALGLALTATYTEATDYFLTIGGGYSPAGNQASLEANVQFYQRILKDKHPGPRVHDIFFADGNDPAKDLQVQATSDRPVRPVTELLSALHRRGPPGGAWIRYRNHEVSGIAGGNEPLLIRQALERIAQTAQPGDRLILYVTAHGDEALEDDDPFNTSISCWGETEIRMQEFTRWLDKLPESMPVVMVMAQCYCGGFSHVMYEGGDPERGLSKRTRVGFFAQRHDLPAAGCRPDIENDEEYSSYFWGAMIGQSRTGKPMPGCDADGSGQVSFEEAHAQALIAGQTIDILLKTSDVLLEQYSRIRRTGEDSDDQNEKPLLGMQGPIESLLAEVSPATRRVVVELCRELELPLTGDVADVSAALRKHRNSVPGGPGFRPGRRSNSGRRELLAEVTAQWPELGDPEKWEQSDLLKPKDQTALLKEMEALPSYANYLKRREDREKQAVQWDQHELREVKYRRLVATLESIVRARNLPLMATPEQVAEFQRVLRLEQTELAPRARK